MSQNVNFSLRPVAKCERVCVISKRAREVRPSAQRLHQTCDSSKFLTPNKAFIPTYYKTDKRCCVNIVIFKQCIDTRRKSSNRLNSFHKLPQVLMPRVIFDFYNCLRHFAIFLTSSDTAPSLLACMLTERYKETVRV